MWPPKANDRLPNPEQISNKISDVAHELQSQAVEKEILIKELKGPFVFGYYFTATDKAPKPGEYKYIAQGMFRLGELLAIFTVLTNEASGNVIAETITMLKNAMHANNRASSPVGKANDAEAKGIQIKQQEKDYPLTMPARRPVATRPEVEAL